MVFQIKVPKGELMRTTFSTASIYAYAMRLAVACALSAAALGCSASGALAAEPAPLAGNVIYLGGQRVRELGSSTRDVEISFLDSPS